MEEDCEKVVVEQEKARKHWICSQKLKDKEEYYSKRKEANKVT